MLTTAQILQVQELLAKGVTPEEIVVTTGVGRTKVFEIKGGHYKVTRQPKEHRQKQTDALYNSRGIVFPSTQGYVTGRCPTCGGNVQLPCFKCAIDADLAKNRLALNKPMLLINDEERLGRGLELSLDEQRPSIISDEAAVTYPVRPMRKKLVVVSEQVEVSSLTLVPLCDCLIDGNSQSADATLVQDRVTVMRTDFITLNFGPAVN